MSNNFSVERILSENTQSVNNQPIISEFSNKLIGTIVDRKRRILEKSIKDITNSDVAKHRRTSSSEQIECQSKLQNQCDNRSRVKRMLLVSNAIILSFVISF